MSTVTGGSAVRASSSSSAAWSSSSPCPVQSHANDCSPLAASAVRRAQSRVASCCVRGGKSRTFNNLRTVGPRSTLVNFLGAPGHSPWVMSGYVRKLREIQRSFDLFFKTPRPEIVEGGVKRCRWFERATTCSGPLPCQNNCKSCALTSRTGEQLREVDREREDIPDVFKQLPQ